MAKNEERDGEEAWEAGFSASREAVAEHLLCLSPDRKMPVCTLCGHDRWSVMVDPDENLPARFSTSAESGWPSQKVNGERQFFHLSCINCGNTHWIDVWAVGRFLLNKDKEG